MEKIIQTKGNARPDFNLAGVTVQKKKQVLYAGDIRILAMDTYFKLSIRFRNSRSRTI